MAELGEGDFIDRRILVIRGRHVMVSGDLARLCGLPAKAINRAAQRHIDRFPEDMMFHLDHEESEVLKGRSGALGWGRHAKYLPRAFSEEGIAMLCGLLRRRKAAQASLAIKRAFIRLRWREFFAPKNR
ncbi:MAG: ORF6N domain-containing protein [Elusimicrobia bacterium]|nr:ORF6N domain-containing protein [Elusimicrobiota bacterium]